MLLAECATNDQAILDNQVFALEPLAKKLGRYRHGLVESIKLPDDLVMGGPVQAFLVRLKPVEWLCAGLK